MSTEMNKSSLETINSMFGLIRFCIILKRFGGSKLQNFSTLEKKRILRKNHAGDWPMREMLPWDNFQGSQQSLAF